MSPKFSAPRALRITEVCVKLLVVSILTTGLAAAGTVYQQTNLVSDIPGLAAVTDPNLKNPWGMSFTATSPFWISDADTNLSTLYNGRAL